MKNFRVLLFIVLFVAILLVLKFIFFPGQSADKKRTVASKPMAVLVSAVVAQAGQIDNKVFVTGTAIANEEVELKPEVSGKILRLAFKEGSNVKKGDLLVKINDSDLQAQLKKAQLQVKLSAEHESRQKKLLDISGISQEEYDLSLNQLNSLKADVDFITAQVSKTEIRAPFDGIIGLKEVSEGSFVSPNQVIASLQQVDPIKIDLSIPEKYADLVRNGDRINFTTAGSNEKFTGEIFAIEPKIDVTTRTLHLRAISPNKQRKIFPGSFIKAELVLKQINNAVMLPTEAIVPVLKGKNVFIFRDGKAVTQKVETGIRTDVNIQILEGVQPGDTIITTGLMQLRDGMPVKLSNEK